MAKKQDQKIKISVDLFGNTISVWWDDPKKEVINWESDDSWDILNLDKNNKVIGFEKLNFLPKEVHPFSKIRKLEDMDKISKQYFFSGEINADVKGLLEKEIKM